MTITPYPGDERYGVTEDGRVFRIVRSNYGRRVPFEMKPRFDTNGYLIVGGGRETRRVQRMVAETFLPNPQEHPHVAHNDGTKTNNCVENLRWATALENQADLEKHGTLMLGEQHVCAKLTEQDVKQARARAALGESHTEIAKGLPVERSVLSRAIRKDTWRHVD